MNAKRKKGSTPATTKQAPQPKRRQVAQEMPSFEKLPEAPTAATSEDEAAPASVQRPPADS